MRRAALLLMDYQVAICGPDGKLGTASGLSAHTTDRKVLPRVAGVLAAVRRHGLPVLHVRVAFDPAYLRRTNRSARFGGMEKNGLLRAGDPDTEFVPEAAPADGEAVFEKGCVNPFIGTGLEQRLTTLGVRELYLGGVATNFVVESAARHAGDSGYAVTVLEDLCASYSQEMHEFAITRTLPTFAAVDSSDTLVAALGAGEPGNGGGH
ncbi:cysteine hydrolase family protein [Actinophytocola sp.]|uniref:cysteine hydrolase family protein n=1 Tax=Actinophytocola sp. TaxID=1872138 RepID=UPI0025B7B2EB|nr:isochorismatase family cysteine hydrolase [Actinophytocola sp.]